MSQRNIFKSPFSNHRSTSRGKAPIHLSPKTRMREPYGLAYEDSSLTPPKNNQRKEGMASENVLKIIQPPL